jgi:mannose-6-phosphate isomerase-like protein (cupin superfamily)
VCASSRTEKFGRFDDLWSPKIVADLNDSHVKLAKVQGEFVWHQHAAEDELFVVLRGELVVIPKGSSIGRWRGRKCI